MLSRLALISTFVIARHSRHDLRRISVLDIAAKPNRGRTSQHDHHAPVSQHADLTVIRNGVSKAKWRRPQFAHDAEFDANPADRSKAYPTASRCGS
jgi:hypothetical protein